MLRGAHLNNAVWEWRSLASVGLGWPGLAWVGLDRDASSHWLNPVERCSVLDGIVELDSTRSPLQQP